jgi:hypothetical protein
MATRDIIERLGKEGRDALEAQRVSSEKARLIDLDRTTSDTQRLLSSHASSLLQLEIKQKDILSRAHEEQKRDLEGVLKQSIHEKEKAFERAKEAYMVSQGIEKDSALNILRSQHEVKLDKQWSEITQLREIALEAEMSHQKGMYAYVYVYIYIYIHMYTKRYICTRIYGSFKWTRQMWNE